MDVSLYVKIKSKVQQVIAIKWVKLVAMILAYTVLIMFVLTLFGKRLSLTTFIASLGLYFIYNEVIEDFKDMARLHGGSR